MIPVSYTSQTNLNETFSSACPKFCRSSAAIRSTPGALFDFRPLNAFSNSSFKIESLLSSFCTSLSFSMRSATQIVQFGLKMITWGFLRSLITILHLFPLKKQLRINKIEVHFFTLKKRLRIVKTANWGSQKQTITCSLMKSNWGS